MKKLFLTAFLMAISLWIFNAKAETGTCGTNCEYVIDGETLTIRPIDASQPASTDTYLACEGDYCYNHAPWYGSNVSKVVVSDGVTSLGAGAFFLMANVTSAELPEGLNSIGGSAFESTGITNIDLPSALTSLNGYAFAYTPLRNINSLPEGITELPFRVFCNTELENFVVPMSVTSISSGAFGGDDAWHSQALIKNFYCHKSIANQCEAAVEWRKNNGDDITVIEYTTEDGVYKVGDNYYASATDLGHWADAAGEEKAAYVCSNLDTCKAKVLNNKGICENIDKDCKDIVEAKNDGQYCDSFEACKTLVDMKNSGENCDSLESCKALSDMAASGEYCSTVEECKALNDMVGGENCDSLASCKALSDMAAMGEYCSTVAECKGFMDLMNSGYCEGFEACKEMFNADVINYDGKRYGSLEDLYNGNALPSITRQEQGDGSFAVYKDGVFAGYKGKRIYTMEEANRVTKPMGNTLKIKYR